jgi:predicted transcriptional regulator
VVATLGLVVLLEVWPVLATYAPAIFPALAVVGALNLAMISQQERRETTVEAEKVQRREQRRASRNRNRSVQESIQRSASRAAQSVHRDAQDSVLDVVNRTRRQRKAAILDAMVDIYLDSPRIGATELSRRLSIGRSTVYNYLSELEVNGRIARKDGTVKVLEEGR